jgi:hypothetical protein
MTIQEIASGLRARKSGHGYMAKCPAHKDRTPSLHLTEKNGKILIHCFAGCEQHVVIQNLIDLGLWPRRERLPYPVYRHVRQLEQFIAQIDTEKERLLAVDGSDGSWILESLDRQAGIEPTIELRDWESADWQRWMDLCRTQGEARKELKKLLA